MHLLPLINVNQSGIRIRVLLERLLTLLKAEGKTGCPVFCDEEGKILLARSIESIFHPIMEEIQEYRDRSLEDSIPRRLEANNHYQCNRSLRRGADNQELENGFENSVINFVYRCLNFEGSKGNQPGFNMLEHYAAGDNTRYLHLRFVRIL